MHERRTTRGRVRSEGFLAAIPFLVPTMFLAPVTGELPGVRELPRSVPMTTGPVIAPGLAPLAARIEAENSAERDAALALLDGYRPLLRFLPIDDLERIRVRRDELELAFDFGRRSTRMALPRAIRSPRVALSRWRRPRAR